MGLHGECRYKSTQKNRKKQHFGKLKYRAFQVGSTVENFLWKILTIFPNLGRFCNILIIKRLEILVGLTRFFPPQTSNSLSSNFNISPRKMRSNFLANKKSLKNLYKTFWFPGALFYVYKIPVNNRGLRLCSSFPISRLFPSSSINRQYELFWGDL